MDVSIIIVNYNTRELISNCIRSIFEKTTDIDYEIIVVDNASNDGSQQMITDKFPKVKLIEFTENIGFGRANNRGVKIAKGKYLFFLNSDTELKNNSVKFFFDFMEQYNTKENIGAVGSLLLDIEGNPIHSSGSFLKPLNDIFFIIKKYINPNIKKKERKFFDQNENSFYVDYITGADLFIPRHVFDKLNGFDEIFFMYCEETDLQLRMKKQNLRRLIIKGPEIIHFEGSSFNYIKKKSNLRRILIDTSHFIYFKKNCSLLSYYLYRILFVFARFLTIVDNSYTLNERIYYLKNLIKKV